MLVRLPQKFARECSDRHVVKAMDLAVGALANFACSTGPNGSVFDITRVLAEKHRTL